jgi:hypothetical protein
MKTVISYEMTTLGSTEVGTYRIYESITVVTPAIGTTLAVGPGSTRAKVLGYLDPISFRDKTEIRMICRKILKSTAGCCNC